MIKDKVTAIRINSDILGRLKLRGITPQKIVDKFITRHFDIEVKTKIKEKKK